MASIIHYIFAILIAFCLLNLAIARPYESTEREIIKAEIKHEAHKLRMLRELLNELDDDKPVLPKSRSRRHRNLSHKDDCYFHPVTC